VKELEDELGMQPSTRKKDFVARGHLFSEAQGDPADLHGALGIADFIAS
jgi:hypothetical protein